MSNKLAEPHKEFLKTANNVVVAGALSAINPGLGIAYGLATSFIGGALELRHDKAMEWVEMFEKNRSVFEKIYVTREDFQDAFLSALEDYIKLRSILKRGIAQKIFLGYATSDDKDVFALEKYNQTLRNISLDALRFMSFLDKDIEPLRQARVLSGIEVFDVDKSQIPKQDIIDSVSRQQLLSYAYKDWLGGRGESVTVMVPSKVDSSSPTITSESAVYIPDKVLAKNTEALAELQTLGLIWRNQYSTTNPGWDAVPEWIDIWSWTNYGNEFSIFVKEGEL